MRPFATLMLLLQLPVILSVFSSFLRRQPWVRYLPAVSLILLMIHVRADQEPFFPRMAPAYLLVAASFALNLPWLLHDTRPHIPRWLTVTGTCLGIILFAIAVAVPVLLLPFKPLPAPTGPYRVQTRVYQWARSSLDQTGRIQTLDDNRITVQVWYPADLADEMLVDGKRSDAGQSAAWPFVFYAPGTFGSRSSGVSTCLELASHGYIVASIDHPGQALFTRLPGGGFELPDRQYLEEALAFSSGRLGLADETRLGQKWQAIRVADIRLVLEQLAALASSGSDPLMARIDLARIGIVGHSLGAGAALQICREDQICQALALLDGSLYGDVALPQNNVEFTSNAEPYTWPLLCLLSAKYAQDMESHAISSLMSALFQQARAPAFQEIIEQAGSLNMTSLVLQSPILARLLGGSGSIDAVQGLKLTNASVLAFLNCYLKGNCAADSEEGAGISSRLVISSRNVRQ